jgi:hypothetical protein
MSEEKFIKIEDYKNDINRVIEEINDKCIQLDIIYKKYIKQIETNSDFTMSLDTLFFQIAMTKKDVQNYKDLFNLFLYQMYGQYYKLFIKIKGSYIENINITENIPDVDFSPFDDINYKIYTFEEISKIHDTIVNIIKLAKNHVSKNEYEIEDDTVRVNKGIGIDNLVFEKQHHTQILINKNTLHNEMLNKLYKYQEKFLSRIMLKLKLLYFQIVSDIQFESFNYTSTASSRESITNALDNKLKNVANRQNFEVLLMEEFKDKEGTGRFSTVVKFFNKFCIYT